MKTYLILLAVLFVGVFLFSGLQNKETQKGFFYDYLPVSHSDCEVVKHTYYSLCYSKKHEQASWVYYLLSDSMIVGSSERKNYFPKDVFVTTGTSSYGDYTNSGFDRGHLLPAADMKWNQFAMNETFLMSNVAPQNRGFNQYGLWKKLETHVRKWVVERKHLHVFVGGVLTENLEKMSNTNISVPKYFYKILFDEANFTSIAFLLKNSNDSKNLTDFVVPIDSVELITNIDFFSVLTEKKESILERSVELEGWF